MTKQEKKERKERIAMIGKENISWWTGERIGAIVFPIIFVLSIYGLRFFPNPSFLYDLAGLGMTAGSVCTILFGTLALLYGGKVYETLLEVKRIIPKDKVEVLGNDGETHVISFNNTEFVPNSDKSKVRINSKINEPKITLMAGKDLVKF